MVNCFYPKSLRPYLEQESHTIERQDRTGVGGQGTKTVAPLLAWDSAWGPLDILRLWPYN